LYFVLFLGVCGKLVTNRQGENTTKKGIEMEIIVREVLSKLEFGNPVAEFDQGLSQYFLETDTYLTLMAGNVDMIAGEKGTGKTAIYQHLMYQHQKQRAKEESPLKGIEIITGFNPSGEPIFRRLGDSDHLTEAQYVTVWKLYFLSLIGNWYFKKYRGRHSATAQKLEVILSKIGLLSIDDSAATVFSSLMACLKEITSPHAVGVEITFNEFGFLVLTPKIEFGRPVSDPGPRTEAEHYSHTEAYDILEQLLSESNLTIWVMMDRLDEAFVGRPDVEKPALRALIRTFMDLLAYKHLKIKLFVRNDLLRKITQDGFVNLTHVNARKMVILWDDHDLYAMLCERIRNNREIVRSMGLQRAKCSDLFDWVFPKKVDAGENRPSTWNWMLSQIRDGNGVKAPRNLIDLSIMAQEEQLRYERRSPRSYVVGQPLIEPRALKQALVRLSKQRLEDTLLAEYGQDVKTAIRAFQNSKAEHNEQSLAALFGIETHIVRLWANILMDIGFLEHLGNTYKIPPLYRPGLNITQGKAF
jgi:hypothetical protein